MSAPACAWRMCCGLCGDTHLTPVLELAPTPPANAFVSERALGEAQACFPLELVLCEGCRHVQLAHVLDRYRLLGDPLDADAGRPEHEAHNRAWARQLMERCPASEQALVVDIGSNDGSLLKLFEDAGWRVQGVEPSVNVAAVAMGRGIQTHPGFFQPSIAARIADERGQAQLVIAHELMSQTDDPSGFLEGVRMLLQPDGLFSFEVPSLHALVADAGIDMITHLTLDYHSIAPLVRALDQSGLELIAVSRTRLHGSRLRGLARPVNGTAPVEASVAALLVEERRMGLAEAETYRALASRLETIRNQLAVYLASAKTASLRVAAYGAQAGATTLLYQLGLDADVITFTADESPLHAGCYTPGLHIPVVASAELEARRPDVVIVLDWQDAKAIAARHPKFQAAGGRFLCPLPVPALCA
ncbi:MAG: class I SAM-dependent methyltransferase [Defluviicoccus sp.]